MKNISIDKPCGEDWSKMNPTEQGAFCQKCAIDVIDFTQKTPSEVKEILRQNQGKHLCGHFGEKQLELLNNDDYTFWQGQSKRTFQSKFLCALVLVFGLTLFSCSTQEERIITALNQTQSTIAVDHEDETVAETFGKTIEAATFQNHLEEHPTAPVPPLIEWGMFVDGGIGWDAGWVEMVQEEPIAQTTEISHVLGGVMYTEAFTRVEELITLKDSSESLLPDPILNESDPFETKLFPNPTRNVSNLLVFTKEEAQYDIQLFNMNGQLIQEIHSGQLQAGEQRFEIDLYDQQPGLYLARIISGEQTETVKIQKL